MKRTHIVLLLLVAGLMGTFVASIPSTSQQKPSKAAENQLKTYEK